MVLYASPTVTIRFCICIDQFQVQGEAQGSNEQLDEFVQHLKSGPSAANVTDIEHSEVPTKSGENGFTVK